MTSTDGATTYSVGPPRARNASRCRQIVPRRARLAQRWNRKTPWCRRMPEQCSRLARGGGVGRRDVSGWSIDVLGRRRCVAGQLVYVDGRASYGTARPQSGGLQRRSAAGTCFWGGDVAKRLHFSDISAP